MNVRKSQAVIQSQKKGKEQFGEEEKMIPPTKPTIQASKPMHSYEQYTITRITDKNALA